MRGFVGLCLLLTGLSIGAYSHYPGPAHREASLVELTEIVTGAVHTSQSVATVDRPAHAAQSRTQKSGDAVHGALRATVTSMKPGLHFERCGWFANAKILAAAQPELIAPPARVVSRQHRKLRVLAIKEPPKRVGSTHAPSRPTTSGWRTAVVQVAAVPLTKSGTHRKSLAPTTAAERWKLIKAIQAELKRVGCYWGRVDGVWGKGSKWGMAEFMRSVNAALPTKNPDYIQLQLVSSHTSKVCGRDNVREQIATRSAPKPHQQQTWHAQVAAIKPDPSVNRRGRLTTGSLRTNGRHAADESRSTHARSFGNADQRRPKPLPGRMAVGARDVAPELVEQPRRITRQGNVPYQPAGTNANRQRVKLSALGNPATEFNVEGRPMNGDDPRAATDGNYHVDPFVARQRAAAKARRAAQLRKAKAKKKRRRYTRNRYRRRSLQSLFMHPLGRR